jgi:hypothetical protein
MTASVLHVPTFVVLSGGPIGTASVRQLLRGVAAGRLATERIVVVDRDPHCDASRLDDPRVELAGTDWTAWLEAHADGVGPAAHLVPYHWAPHVLVDWLAAQAARAGGSACREGDVPTVGTPVDRATRDGSRALSYATWICPPTCIEPALCPHTRGPKDWSLAGELAGPAMGDARHEPIVFRCLHLVWGVGTVPMSAILAARDRVVAGIPHGSRRYLVATSSHCHALATMLEVSPVERLGEIREGTVA